MGASRYLALVFSEPGISPKMPNFEPAPQKGDLGNEAEDREPENVGPVS